MAKRQTNRKVVIRYVGRDPKDPHAVLDAVERAFRPKEIEILVESHSDAEENLAVPNEQLETQARQVAAQELDRLNNEADNREPRSKTSKEEGSRRLILQWLQRLVASGWKVVVKILPTLQKIKDLFE